MGRTMIRLTGAAIIGVLAFEVFSLTSEARLVASMVIGLPAFVLMIVSRRQLGQFFSVMPEAKGLVMTGLYSRIQHPMYVFLDLFILAVILALDLPILLVIWALLVILQIVQSRREEKVLSANFGVEYDTYASRTWF